MKCLMLLVLVAVCRGVVIRDPQREQRVDHRKQADQLREVEKYLSQTKQSSESPRQQLVQVDQLVQPLEKSTELVQEQLEKLHHEQPYRVKEFMDQELERSPLKTFREWRKQLEKMPLKSVMNSPFIQYSKPTTFLDYIKIFNNKPLNQMTTVYPDVLDFKNFRDLIQFPGGDFLQQEIDKCLWNMPEDTKVPLYTNGFTTGFPFHASMQMEMGEVKDIRDVLPFILTQLEKMVPLYMQTTTDPSTMAMLVTRDLIKIILHGRMKCHTTTWDKYFIENINDQLHKTTNEMKYQLLENFRTILPEVVPEVMPEIPDLINQLVYTITRDVQEHVYKDVMQYAHGVAFKDVAILSHKLYHEVKQVFKESWQQDVPVFMQQLVTMVTELVADYGTCPKEQHFYNMNKLACWDFNKLFLEREVSTIHSRVMSIVHHYLYHTCTGEECMQYYPRVTELFRTIIQRYIATIIQRVPMCQTPECLDPTKCMLNRYQFPDSNRMDYNHMDQFRVKIPFWNPLWNKIYQNRQY